MLSTRMKDLITIIGGLVSGIIYARKSPFIYLGILVTYNDGMVVSDAMGIMGFSLLGALVVRYIIQLFSRFKLDLEQWPNIRYNPYR